jgi:hypothetical protein
MARLKNFSELSLKKDKDLPNLKIPVQGPKGNSKYTRMKIAYTDAPGTSDIKKAIKAEAVHSADKRPEKYRKPDGKIGIRMVPMDKEVVKREAIVDPNDLKGRPKKADPNPESPYGIKHPMHPANLKKKQTKESIDDHPKVKAARKAHAAGTWNGNVNKEGEAVVHINGKPHTVTNKSKTKNLRKEEQNGLMKEESVDEATWPDEMPNDVDEALNMSQRIKRSRLMKRLKGRIAVGRRRAKKKMANKQTLTKRSNRQARNAIAKKLTRGIPKSELTFARKQEIEKRLDKPALKQRIARLAKRMFKDVRKKEVERKKG